MREHLLACLEKVVAFLDVHSDLPPVIEDACQGVRCAYPRADALCTGYRFRAHYSECRLASMLLWSVADFVYFKESVMHHHKLRAAPPPELVREVLAVLHAYTESGGVIGEPDVSGERSNGVPRKSTVKEIREQESNARQREEEKRVQWEYTLAVWTDIRKDYPYAVPFVFTSHMIERQKRW